MTQRPIHHREKCTFDGLGCYFHALEPCIASTPGKCIPLRNETWSTDPAFWSIDTLFLTWSVARPSLLECGILYFSTYSKLWKHNTHTHTYYARYCLICPNNACLRPRNTEIMTMSWPPRNISSTKMIKLIKLDQAAFTDHWHCSLPPSE